MPNEEYQALFGASRRGRARRRVLDAARPGASAPRSTQLLDDYAGGVAPLVRDLGGHDLADVLDALAPRARDARPADGDLRLHDQGLRPRDRRAAAEPLRAARRASRSTASAPSVGLTAGDRVGRRSRRTRPRARCSPRPARRLDRGERAAGRDVAVPATLVDARPARRPRRRPRSAAILLDLSRVEGVGERLVTVSPDVSVSTNLGGFINKTGVWGPEEEPVYDAMDDSPLSGASARAGQHIEMGIAEMNLVLAARPARPHLGLPARAALPDRHALRPVRDARARGHRLLAPTRAPGSCSPARRPGSRSRARAAPTSRSTRPGSGSRPPG